MTNFPQDETDAQPDDLPELQEPVELDTELFHERLEYLQEALPFTHRHLLGDISFLVVLAGAQPSYLLAYPHDYLDPEQPVHEEFQQALEGAGLSITGGEEFETYGVSQQELTIENESAPRPFARNIGSIRQQILEDELVKQLAEDETVLDSQKQWELAHNWTKRRIRTERVRQFLESQRDLEHGWRYSEEHMTFYRRHEEYGVYEEIEISATAITLLVNQDVGRSEIRNTQTFGVTWSETAEPGEGPAIRTPHLFLHKAYMRKIGGSIPPMRLFVRIYPTPGFGIKRSWIIPQELPLQALEAYMLDKDPLLSVEARNS